MDPSASGSGAAVPKQNESSDRKRRPTEKRKLQNRIAQRKYRENLKSRLENLERQAAEIADQQNGTIPVAASTSARDLPAAPLIEENSFDFLLDMTNDDAPNQFLATDSEAFEFPDFPAFPNMESIFDSPPEAGTAESSNSRNDSNPDASTSLDDEFAYEFYINQMSEERPVPRDPPNQFSQVTEKVPWSPWRPTPKWPNGKSPAKAIDNFVRLTPDAGTIRSITVKTPKPSHLSQYTKVSPIFSADLVTQLRLDDSKENHSLVKTALARGYNIRDVFLAGLAALDKQETLQPRTGFDPYKNTLTLIPTSTLQAFLSNGLAIGLPIPKIKSETFQSLFYQPEALAAGNMAGLEAVWNEFPKCLRPTRAQISIAHHPWMDMIPFPTLRDRALTLGTMSPPMIDLNDFKNDIFMNSGIFCWRTGGKDGTGQPWDLRSWEAEPWFLKKWWILVGGETGEIWEQTQWWRTLRGKPKVEMDGAAR